MMWYVNDVKPCHAAPFHSLLQMFQRIWANESRNLSHKYSFSYQREVGSSFDPAMDDPSQLEESFQEGTC
jgi:hypothetical protein